MIGNNTPQHWTLLTSLSPVSPCAFRSFSDVAQVRSEAQADLTVGNVTGKVDQSCHCSPTQAGAEEQSPGGRRYTPRRAAAVHQSVLGAGMQLVYPGSLGEAQLKKDIYSQDTTLRLFLGYSWVILWVLLGSLLPWVGVPE